VTRHGYGRRNQAPHIRALKSLIGVGRSVLVFPLPAASTGMGAVDMQFVAGENMLLNCGRDGAGSSTTGSQPVQENLGRLG
jgi:hypothetical protein